MIAIYRRPKYSGGLETTWQSGNQIYTVYNSGYRQKLLNILRKVSVHNNIASIIEKYKTDNLIYEKIIGRKMDPDSRADWHANKNMTYFNNPKAHTYLDIGCGDATITKAYAKLLGAEKVYGIDVKPVQTDIDFYQIDPDNIKFPQKDNSVDLVTSIMVLHHVSNLEKELQEIYRVLKPGGLFCVKEHDCGNHLQAMLIDIEHIMYIKNNQESDPDPHMMHYKTYSEWIKFIEKFGFKLKSWKFSDPMTNTRAFYMTFYK